MHNHARTTLVVSLLASFALLAGCQVGEPGDGEEVACSATTQEEFLYDCVLDNVSPYSVQSLGNGTPVFQPKSAERVDKLLKRTPADESEPEILEDFIELEIEVSGGAVKVKTTVCLEYEWVGTWEVLIEIKGLTTGPCPS